MTSTWYNEKVCVAFRNYFWPLPAWDVEPWVDGLARMGAEVIVMDAHAQSRANYNTQVSLKNDRLGERTDWTAPLWREFLRFRYETVARYMRSACDRARRAVLEPGGKPLPIRETRDGRELRLPPLKDHAIVVLEA